MNLKNILQFPETRTEYCPLSLPVGLTTDPVAHDIWFRSKVKEALEDKRPPMPHDEVEACFEAKRNMTNAFFPLATQGPGGS